MRVELSPKARTSLEELARDASVYRRMVNALEKLRREPTAGKLLKGPLRGLRSYRVGAYRILYEVLGGVLVVYVVDIRHRSMAYRRIR